MVPFFLKDIGTKQGLNKKSLNKGQQKNCKKSNEKVARDSAHPIRIGLPFRIPSGSDRERCLPKAEASPALR